MPRTLALIATLLAGCAGAPEQVFLADGPVARVRVVAERGAVELTGGPRTEVRSRPRSGRPVVETRLRDGLLEVSPRCEGLLPCRTDLVLTVPPGTPVSVELTRGEVWATDASPLTVDVGEGSVDVDVDGPLAVRLGSGTVEATVRRAEDVSLAVGHGDLRLEVPPGPWRLDADAAGLDVDGVAPDEDAPAAIRIVAPAGEAVVRGLARLAAR